MSFFDQLMGKKEAPLKVEAPQNFQQPEPKPLALPENSDIGDLVKSSLAFALRLGTGAFVLGWRIETLFADEEEGKYALKLGPLRIRDGSSVLDQAPRPEKNLILYEYDASPFCKRVREVINLLDLVVEYRPCPGARAGQFSEDQLKRTGRQTVPFLIDPNTGTEMFESNDIIEYLLAMYGPPADTYDRKALWPITWETFSVTTAGLAAVIRGMPGSKLAPNVRPGNEKVKPLTLYGYESSPFVRPVLETLCSLCLPHTMVSSSRGSVHRDDLVARTGRAFQVPYLIDPNTGVELCESTAIVKYLKEVYTF